MDVGPLLANLAVWALPALIAITLHEAAHGWVAWKLGDDTAFQRGRVTFNPLRHIDVFGTVVLPLLLLFLSNGRMMFGYAKPVPINPFKLRHPRRDTVTVAAAGPAMNFAIALIAAFLLTIAGAFPAGFARWLYLNLHNAVWLNVLLAVFNLLPLPPLDGGRVAVGLLPAPMARPLARLEPYGLFILIALLFLVPFVGPQFGIEVNPFQTLVVGPAEWLTAGILRLAGAR